MSVGGDGNYNDVLNGLMRLKPDKRPVVALVPAGNANDHHRAAHDDASFLERLKRGKTEKRDLLKLTAYNPDGADVNRYAHSYIGFGASGRIARALNKHRPSAVLEKLVVMRELMRSLSFKAVVRGSVMSFDSIICAHINEMAKYIKLTEPKSLSDGKFEVIETPGQSRTQLIRQLGMAVVGQEVPHESTGRYSMALLSSVQVQLDGETVGLRSGSTVTVKVERSAIRVLA